MASVEYPHGSEPYSTLEVRNVESSTPQDLGTSNKEAVPNPDSQYPQVVDPPTTWESPKLEANDTDTDTTAVLEQDGEAAKRSICGLSSRSFYIILAVVIIIIIGAIAGGVAGGLVSRQNNSSTTSSPTSDTDTTTNVNVLGESKLAASNWTDAQGNTHRSVFFQDPYNSIIARQWDSQNKTWETRNISQLMKSSTGGPIHPKSGTSLASASSDSRWGSLYEIFLWFSEAADGEEIISWVTSNNPVDEPNFWNYNATDLRTWNGTQLAAAWQRCPYDHCAGFWAVAYQGREGYIRMANASNWMNNTKATIRANAVSASCSLALLPALNGNFVDGLTLASNRRPASMERSTFLGDWNWKQDDGTILDDVDPLHTRQFAATTMNNWNEALFAALSNDGGIRASRWDGKAYSPIPEITFAQGQSTNFSAIAMTIDAMMYGIADDQIWEYSVDTTDPSTFTLASKVYP